MAGENSNLFPKHARENRMEKAIKQNLKDVLMPPSPQLVFSISRKKNNNMNKTSGNMNIVLRAFGGAAIGFKPFA